MPGLCTLSSPSPPLVPLPRRCYHLARQQREKPDPSSLYDTYHYTAQGEDFVHAGLLAPGAVPVPEREVFARNREPWAQKYARESAGNEQ